MNERVLCAALFVILVCVLQYNDDISLFPANLFISALMASFVYGHLILQRRISLAYGLKEAAQVKVEAMEELLNWIFSNITIISIGSSFFAFFTILVSGKTGLYVNLLLSAGVFFVFHVFLTTQANWFVK